MRRETSTAMSRRRLALVIAAIAIARPTAVLAAQDDDAQRPYLAAALSAAQWIEDSARRTEQGLVWPVRPDVPETVSTNLYSGMPGIVLFWLELHHTTKDPSHLEQAQAGADYLIATLPDPDQRYQSGLYTGVAGVAFTLDEVHRVTQQPRYARAAEQCYQLVRRAAWREGDGVQWNASTDIISGSAGIGLYLLHRGERHGDKQTIALAAEAGQRLIQVGQPAPGGVKWPISAGGNRFMPNFSHGTAGVAYFLAELYRHTKDPIFLDKSLAGAKYLLQIADRSQGLRVFHHEPGGEQLFYMGWCHGPVGTVRLFYTLDQATDDEQWSGLVHQSAAALGHSGVPDRFSPGYWNNVGTCCGTAGVAQFYADLHRWTGRAEYRPLADRAAANVLSRATSERGTLRWIHAEHRVQPQNVSAQTGLMQGAAGIGLMLLQLDALHRGEKPSVRLPDVPKGRA